MAMKRLILLMAGLPLGLSAIISAAAQASLGVLLLVEAGSLLVLILVLGTVLRLEATSLEHLDRQMGQHAPPSGERPRLEVIMGGEALRLRERRESKR
jgi:hypothetical protein